MKKEYYDVNNFIFDYDGVISYRNKSIDVRSKEALFKFLRKKDINTDVNNAIVLHINSQRGISFFVEDFTDRIKKSNFLNTKFFFSGCGGGFLYDLVGKKTILKYEGLDIKTVEYIVNSKIIKGILNKTKQGDENLWSKYKHNISKKFLSIIKKEPRLYWDIGFPGSKKIYKCTLDLPQIYDKDSLIKNLKRDLDNVKLDITYKYLDFSNSNFDKGVIMRSMLKEGIYTKGSILAIGDNPKDADKKMLEAFPKKIFNDFSFYSLTNYAGEDNENSLSENFIKILRKVQ